MDNGISQVGRVGGVAKDQLAREIAKRQGKSVLMEVEGGEGVEFEMISLTEAENVTAETESVIDMVDSGSGEDPLEVVEADETLEADDMHATLRDQAATWPRLVAPPLKRSGHVIMDACCPNGRKLKSRGDICLS